MVGQLGTAEIEFDSTVAFRILDSLPKNESCAPEIIEPSVRTTVLINHCVFVCDGNNAGDWPITLRRYTNDDSVFERGNDVAKPSERLRWNSMTTPSEYQQRIKFAEKRLGSTFLVGQVFAFSALDLALNAAFVKPAEKSIDIGAKVDHLQGVGFATANAAVGRKRRVCR